MPSRAKYKKLHVEEDEQQDQSHAFIRALKKLNKKINFWERLALWFDRHFGAGNAGWYAARINYTRAVITALTITCAILSIVLTGGVAAVFWGLAIAFSAINMSLIGIGMAAKHTKLRQYDLEEERLIREIKALDSGAVLPEKTTREKLVTGARIFSDINGTLGTLASLAFVAIKVGLVAVLIGTNPAAAAILATVGLGLFIFSRTSMFTSALINLGIVKQRLETPKVNGQVCHLQQTYKTVSQRCGDAEQRAKAKLANAIVTTVFARLHLKAQSPHLLAQYRFNVYMGVYEALKVSAKTAADLQGQKGQLEGTVSRNVGRRGHEFTKASLHGWHADFLKAKPSSKAKPIRKASDFDALHDLSGVVQEKVSRSLGAAAAA